MNCFAVRKIIKSVALIIRLAIWSAYSYAQPDQSIINQLHNQLDQKTAQHKQISVYLRTSKDIYVCGEDLWFNAFLLDAQNLSLSELDKTLYLQLQQDGADSTVWQEIYPVTGGVAFGHVYIPQNLPEGKYWLKAYTAHSFLSGQPLLHSIVPIRVVKEPRSILNDRNSVSEQTPSAKKDKIQLSILPEGGYLVAGLENRVAFKVADKNGYPVEVKGTLYKGHAAILQFESLHAGMGSFKLTPDQNAQYFVRLQNYPDSLYELPKSITNGIVLRLEKNAPDTLIFKIFARHLLNKKSIFLRLQIRGVVQAIAGGQLADSLEIKFPIQNVPQGIAEATLFDEQLRPLAERLVYLHPEQKLNITIALTKQKYTQKQKVSAVIQTRDGAGNPIPAVLSLSVHDQLFTNPANARNIVTYNHLSTQLRGKIYDPTYYFDASHADRNEALDHLLLTQGWRCYTWNEDNLVQDTSREAVLSNSMKGSITALRKPDRLRNDQPQMLLVINYNRSKSQMVMADSIGGFCLTPDNLSIGSRLFIKHFSKKEHKIQVADPFAFIKDESSGRQLIYEEKKATQLKDNSETYYLQYGKMMDEVTVVAKARGFADKYLGYLDSIAKYEDNNDYVGECGWLNCPSNITGTKPVEGKKYPMFTSKVTSHNKVVLTNDNWTTVIYHYPKYSEKDLLKMFKLTIAKGYHESKAFYEPNYDIEPSMNNDTRNTLVWKPIVVTDKSGEAKVEFFCSDIRGIFIGTVEGVGEEGLLGENTFRFSVN